MMTDVTKKQHYVPQTFLRRYGNEKNQIAVMDKCSKARIYTSNIRNVACQNNFYEVNDKEKNYWEKWYNSFEMIIPSACNSLATNVKYACNGGKVLSSFLKNDFSKIIITQLLRTPNAKKIFTKMGINVANSYIDSVERIYNDKLSKQQINMLEIHRNDENFAYSSFLNYLNSDKNIFKLKSFLFNKIWIVHKNVDYKKYPFVTSDNPVIVCDFINNKTGLGNVNLNGLSTAIYFAISPDLLLGLYTKLEGLEEYDGCVDMSIDKSFIMSFIKLSYEQCDRHLYIPL